MKTRPDTLDTTENESGRAKHKNGTRRPRYRRKHVQERKTRRIAREKINKNSISNMKMVFDALGTVKTSPGEQNMKKGPDAHDTAENESGSAKYECGTRRTRHH
jgi:hypothetical protein